MQVLVHDHAAEDRNRSEEYAAIRCHLQRRTLDLVTRLESFHLRCQSDMTAVLSLTFRMGHHDFDVKTPDHRRRGCHLATELPTLRH